MCWCGRSPCTPPLLAGVCGVGVCVWAGGFGCAPPLLAGVLGCACLCACSPCTPPLLAGVCGVGVCVWVRVSAAPRHSWLGCWGVCVLVYALRLYPATPGWGVRRGCVCLGSGFGCAPPLLAGVLGCVCACVRAPLVPHHSWLGCAVWVCVFGFGFRLRPATPGWGVGVCLFVCVLPLLPATPGWGVRRGCVCLGSGFGCAPPLLAGVLGCACVRAPLVPRHSWLGRWGVCVLVCALRLYPATPGWGVRCGCVCLGSGFGCAPPLLAGVCGVGVCVWARVSAAPRHSWLGCWGVCLLVCALRLYPATPGWGVPCGCVCLGSGFGCAPPLLAGVLGCACLCACSPCTPPLLAPARGVGVCVWVRVLAAPRHSWLGCWGVRVGVRAPPVPRHSWLGCAAWVCVLGLGFRLRPATPGWGVGVCVCWCARPACPPPLLAGVCGVGVCVWARVSAAPRHSWLGCWRVCVLVCLFRLYPATPGWGARCGCVCLGSGFGCAPPLLGGVLGCVCAGVRARLVPRHSWLGCAAWVCVFGLGFRLRPATPGWGVGVCVCWCARPACPPPLLAGVCGVGVCVWARVSAAPRHSWLGCWGVCVLVCLFRLYPATPGWGARCGCVCLGSGFGCAPPLLAGVLGCVCAGVCAPLVPRHSWLGCAAWVCVFGLGFRLRPATPGWGVRVCVCLCARSACTPPLLAGVCGMGVCAWARVSAAPRHSWLGCRGLCVLVCALRLLPATLGWGVRCGCVCLGSGFGCAPPLLAGVLGFVCAGVRAPLVRRHSWLGCAVWVFCVWARVSAAPRHSWLGCWGLCVLVCALRLHPATPGWGVRHGCVCLGSGFGCAPPLLAGVSGFVCACMRAPLAPRHSWLGCAVWVCVLGLGFRLRPATPGWGVGVCVCWCARPACPPPLLAGVCGVGVCVWARVSAAPRHSWLGCWGVCVLVCLFRLYPATPDWGARCGCVCLGSGFGCAPPLLAGVFGCVCADVRAPPVPRHSWLGCAVWVCVLGLGFRLRPATPGWGFWVCVCWCACSSCTPPLLAGVCGVGVCARARVLAPPRLSWLGRVVCGLAVAWHLFLCRGSLCVVRAARVCGTRWPLWLGTCPCAVVVAGGVPLWWPGGPALVRRASSGPVALGAPVGFPVAVVPFPTPGACAPGFTGWLRGATGAGREPGSLCLPLAPAEAGALGSLRVVPVRGPAMGLSLAGPSGVGLGLRALRCLAFVDPVTDASGFPYRPSLDGGLGRCTGAVSCGRRHRPFRVGGRHARVPRVCACACPAWPGRAGRPPGRVLVRLTFPLAGLGALFACSAPSGLGMPCLWLLVFFFFFFFFFPFSSPLPCCAPVVSGFPCFPARGALGFGVLLPHPPLFFFFFLVLPRCALVVSCFACSPARGALGLGVLLPTPPPLFFFFHPFPPVVSGFSWRSGGAVLVWPPGPPPVVWRGVSWCSAALCCVLLRCAVVWWCAVVLCRSFAWLPVPVVCFLPLRVCCVWSGVLCCVFPVLSDLCGAVLVSFRCAVRVVCAVSGGWCCWFLVSLPFVGGLLVALVARRCRLVVCVGFGAGVWSGRRSASSPWCPAPLCCVLWRCAAVWCCAVVPCLLFFLFFSLLGALVFCCSLLVLGSGLFPGGFCSCVLPVRCCAGVPASLLSVRCSLALAGLAGVLCCCLSCLLLGLALLCCLLVGPGGFWCRVSVACCGVSLGAVLRPVAARCAAWRCVVVRCVVSFCSVWCRRALCRVLGRCPSSWGPVPSGAVFCLVPPRCVCFAVVCRCVVLFAVVLCAVCALGCGVVRFLSSLPCAVLLCGPLSLGALLPCALPRGAVLSRGVVVSCPAALLGLFLAWVWLYLLEKPLLNFLKYSVLFFSLFWLVKIK